MSLENQVSRVSKGTKDTLKTLINKLGGNVTDELIDQYPSIALALDDVEPAGSAQQALRDAKSYTDQKISEIPTPDVSGQIGTHNADASAHADIRSSISNHTRDTDIHVTAEEKAAWDAKLDSFTETDPTVPAWAKAASKPTYTASEVGARPDTWMPTAAQVGARPSTWMPSASDVGAYTKTETNTLLQKKGDKSVSIECTLIASSWVGVDAPFTQELAVTDLGAAQNGNISVAHSATFEQREMARDAKLCVTGQSDGKLIISADGEMPDIDIPVVITLLG